MDQAYKLELDEEAHSVVIEVDRSLLAAMYDCMKFCRQKGNTNAFMAIRSLGHKLEQACEKLYDPDAPCEIPNVESEV